MCVTGDRGKHLVEPELQNTKDQGSVECFGFTDVAEVQGYEYCSSVKQFQSTPPRGGATEGGDDD